MNPQGSSSSSSTGSGPGLNSSSSSSRGDGLSVAMQRRGPIPFGQLAPVTGTTCWSPISETPVTLFLSNLLLFAKGAGLLVDQPSGETTKQAAAIGQQIQQSGLLELLLQLLADAAELLQALTAALSSSTSSSDSSGSTSSSDTGGSGIARGGGSNAHSYASATASLAQGAKPTVSKGLLQPAQTLLEMYIYLAACWPSGSYAHNVVPDCVDPVINLAVRCFQTASLFLSDNHSAAVDASAHYAETAGELTSLLYAAEAAMRTVTGPVVADGVPSTPHT